MGVPTLVVLGEKDDRLLIEKHGIEYERLAAAGVDLTLWVIPQASHGLMLGPDTASGTPATCTVGWWPG